MEYKKQATLICLTVMLLMPATVNFVWAADPEKARHQAAYERLKDRYTLDRVAKEKIEVTYDDLVGMAQLLSLNLPVQASFQYEMVFVQHDLSIALGREEESLVIDEQETDSGTLWLLRGCTGRWFAKGREIVVSDAPTLFGKMAVRTNSDGKTIVLISIHRTGSRSISYG